MKKNILILVLLAVWVVCAGICFAQETAATTASTAPSALIKLPKPQTNGSFSLEQTLANRRSVREFTDEPLTITQIGQLCWAAQGITEPNKEFRTAPSAGAVYPIQLYVLLPEGLYVYQPEKHELSLVIGKDLRNSVFNASFNQRVVQKAPCTFMLAGNPKKVEAKYRNRGEKFTDIETGHIAQNIHLQAVTLGLGSVPIGVMDDKTIAQVCKLPENMEVLYLIPVGRPAAGLNLIPVVASAPAALPMAPVTDIRSKHIAIIVPSRYFKETDFYGIQQAFFKEGIYPVIASTVLADIKSVQRGGIQRNIITSTILVKDLKIQDYDVFVFISGSSIGGDYLYNRDILNLVRSANSAGKILAAISDAPAFFANAGIVKGKNITSSVSQRIRLTQAGAKWQRNPIMVDGNIITAGDSAEDSSDSGNARVCDRFATAIVGMLKGQRIAY